MPKVTVYIRNEDIEAWKAVPQKTAFISKALAKPKIDFSADPKAPLSLHDLPVEVHQKMFKVCKHGADPKFCRFAKAGKPCK